MKDENCIFCKIANGEIPSVSVYEDEEFRVIFDISPATAGHMLILPKEHAADLTELSPELSGKLLPLAARLGRASLKAFSAKGFNLVQNNGEAAGQTVRHFHMHIIPRYGEELLLWEPGKSDPEALRLLAEKLEDCL